MTRTAIRLGEEAIVLREDDSGIELESPVRLAPGRWVALGPARGPARRALVWSWQLVAVGSTGPRYRGWCFWNEPTAGTCYPTRDGSRGAP